MARSQHTAQVLITRESIDQFELEHVPEDQIIEWVQEELFERTEIPCEVSIVDFFPIDCQVVRYYDDSQSERDTASEDYLEHQIDQVLDFVSEQVNQ